MTDKALILRTLESLSHACLDNEAEREAVAAALISALHARPDAQRIRAAFANAHSPGTRIIVMREIGGKREGELLDAAARLAGCPV